MGGTPELRKIFMKHTTGPWKQHTLLVVDATGNTVAHCTRWEGVRTPRPDIAMANAKLIATTPDLLAAAMALVLACDEAAWDIVACIPHADHMLAISQARRAILSIVETLDQS